MVHISTRAQTFSLHHPVITAATPKPLSYRHFKEINLEILLFIPNKYCRRNARFPVHTSPHRKFPKCAARVLIHPACSKDSVLLLSKELSALKHGLRTFLYSAVGELVCSGQLWARATLRQLRSYKVG